MDMDGLEADTKLIKGLVEYTGLTPAAMARAINVAKTTINRPASGKATARLSGPTLAKLKERFPDFPGWTDEIDQRMPFRAGRLPSNGDPISPETMLDVAVVDLEQGIVGLLADGLATTETKRFPHGFIRRFTNAPAPLLFFSYGVGDNMAPTINDGDLILIDKSRTEIALNDQIWLVALAGIGMVKRVRVNGEMAILLSDNALVPGHTALINDLKIIGRIVAIIKGT